MRTRHLLIGVPLLLVGLAPNAIAAGSNSIVTPTSGQRLNPGDTIELQLRTGNRPDTMLMEFFWYVSGGQGEPNFRVARFSAIGPHCYIKRGGADYRICTFQWTVPDIECAECRLTFTRQPNASDTANNAHVTVAIGTDYLLAEPSTSMKALEDASQDPDSGVVLEEPFDDSKRYKEEFCSSRVNEHGPDCSRSGEPNSDYGSNLYPGGPDGEGDSVSNESSEAGSSDGGCSVARILSPAGGPWMPALLLMGLGMMRRMWHKRTHR